MLARLISVGLVLAALVVNGAVTAAQVPLVCPPSSPDTNLCPSAGSQTPENGWYLTVVQEKDQSLLRIQTGNTEAICAGLTLPVPGGPSIAVKAVGDQIQIESFPSSDFANPLTITATANQISRNGSTGCILTLRNRVRFHCQVSGHTAEITADVVQVNLVTGHVETEMGLGNSNPVGPIQPCSMSGKDTKSQLPLVPPETLPESSGVMVSPTGEISSPCEIGSRHPAYVIAPPDILTLDVERVPKSSYRIEPQRGTDNPGKRHPGLGGQRRQVHRNVRGNHRPGREPWGSSRCQVDIAPGGGSRAPAGNAATGASGSYCRSDNSGPPTGAGAAFGPARRYRGPGHLRLSLCRRPDSGPGQVRHRETPEPVRGRAPGFPGCPRQ